MTDLSKKAFGGLLQFLMCLPLFVFLPAWTLKYWQAWIFLGVFSVSTLAITKSDPKLLERRVHAGPGAEKEKKQKIIQSVMTLAFIVVIVLPAIDHRHSWSMVPWYMTMVGDIAVVFGFLTIFFVFRVNTFTSGIVEVDPEQQVVSSGLYALVRHPMYMGAVGDICGYPVEPWIVVGTTDGDPFHSGPCLATTG